MESLRLRLMTWLSWFPLHFLTFKISAMFIHLCNSSAAIKRRFSHFMILGLQTGNIRSYAFAVWRRQFKIVHMPYYLELERPFRQQLNSCTRYIIINIIVIIFNIVKCYNISLYSMHHAWWDELNKKLFPFIFIMWVHVWLICYVGWTLRSHTFHKRQACISIYFNISHLLAHSSAQVDR